MQELPIGNIIWKTVGRILVIGLAAAVAGAGISLLFPLKFSSTMRLLIIQKQLSAADPYTAIKASERISDNLGQIIYTTSFFDKVTDDKYKIDKSIFSDDEIKRRRQWSDMISYSVVRGTGMLEVSVYHTVPAQAELISNAVANVLISEGWTYVGGGDLQVKLVDEPLRSRWPVKPNVPINAFTGLVLGLLAGTGYSLASARRKNILNLLIT
jgi:capsular polysaccharide biosynthesis protein